MSWVLVRSVPCGGAPRVFTSHSTRDCVCARLRVLQSQCKRQRIDDDDNSDDREDEKKEDEMDDMPRRTPRVFV